MRVFPVIVFLMALAFAAPAMATWYGYEKIEWIQIYPGDGTSSMPPAVMVKLIDDAEPKGFPLVSEGEKLMLRTLQEAYGQDRKVKLWVPSSGLSFYYYYWQAGNTWGSSNVYRWVRALEIGKPGL